MGHNLLISCSHQWTLFTYISMVSTLFHFSKKKSFFSHFCFFILNRFLVMLHLTFDIEKENKKVCLKFVHCRRFKIVSLKTIDHPLNLINFHFLFIWFNLFFYLFVRKEGSKVSVNNNSASSPFYRPILHKTPLETVLLLNNRKVWIGIHKNIVKSPHCDHQS